MALCAADAIPEGEGRGFTVSTADGGELRVVVVHHQGAFHAFENRCAHFGVPLNVTTDYRFLDRGALVCQVHYARYDPQTGACLGGECNGEGLCPLALSRRGDRLYLHLPS
ncbi:Rieske 2Fe-2S domain-containing protein [Endothiovibrio diazotrophicus]